MIPADVELCLLLLSAGSQQDIPASEDVHTVASLLKLYLRELPEPIIPFSSFQTAIKVTRSTMRMCALLYQYSLCVHLQFWRKTKMRA